MLRRNFIGGAVSALALPSFLDGAKAQTVTQGSPASPIPAVTPGIGAIQQTYLTGALVDTTNNSLNSRAYCVAPPQGLTNLTVAFAGFGANNPEQFIPGPFTATCAVEYPVGTFTPFTFSGSGSVTVKPSENLFFSDNLSIAIPAGATFYIKTFASWTAGNFWLTQDVAFTLASEWCNRGTGLSDNTQTATTFSPTGSPAAGLSPWVLTLSGLPKVLGVIGDSIAFAAPDSPSPIDGSRFINRAMRQQIPVVNLARTGDGFGLYLQQYNGRRQLLLGRVTHLISEYGTNDTFGSITLATLQAQAQAAWAQYLSRGIKVWQCTLTPRTTSTDNWATTGNQTIVSSAAETLMQGFNSWIRANYASLGLSGYIDMRHAVDPTDSGVWNVDGVAGTTAAGFCTLTAGTVSACSLATYTGANTSNGTGYPLSTTIPCIVYGMPGETGTLPTITANTNGSGSVTGFNVTAAGSNLLYPPMVAPQGQWTVDGTHPNARGFNAIISSTSLGPALFT